MKNKAPFKKPPTSQYKKSEFYWRGGDKYREQEYISDEYKKALMEYRQAEIEYQQVENEVAMASTTLHERSNYTKALAGFLDGDTEGFTEENDLKRRLYQIEQEIRDEETELEKWQEVHNPAVASGLQKEKAYFLIEIQRNAKAISMSEEETELSKEQLSACTVNKKYRSAQQLEYQLDKLQKKKKFLRNLVNKTKNEFDNLKKDKPENTPEAKIERSLYQEEIDLKMTLMGGEEKKERRAVKHKNHLNFLIDQIEELNLRMSEIQLEDQMVDTDQLRDKYINNDNGNEEEDVEENGDNGNQNNQNQQNSQDANSNPQSSLNIVQQTMNTIGGTDQNQENAENQKKD